MSWITENYGFDFESEYTYQKVSINQLSSHISQVVLYGIVIGKQDIRRIISKKQAASERFVLNFSIRDSPNDTINAACWGDESSISTLGSCFTLVKIKNPQIIERQAEAADEKFRPQVNSQYTLNISPQHSEITTCLGEERREYEKLLHCTMHPASETLNLADIVYNSESVEGLTVNLLVAVRDIGTLQTVKTRDGRDLKKLLLTVFDQSHAVFHILIWEEETANFLLKYCSKRSVLYVADIKVNYSPFMKEMVATSGSTTIFTPEPEIAEGRVLYQYAMKATLPNDKDQISNISNDSSTVYTIEKISKLINSTEITMDEIQGTLHAFLAAFDIDGTSKISSLRCPGCLQLLQKINDKCVNGLCEVGSGAKTLPAEEIFDLIVSLIDNTGCLPRCLFTGQAAQHLLGFSVKDFSKLSEDEKTALKWSYLFERFVVRFKISQSSAGNGRAIFRIISCEKMEL
ncbi:meiosis-specific with OB domain-containing protein-like isoform X2 [Stegodyphus dumicola]|uniref:meiosis-specific with OB domain-containing protein-like isoform X2 n=1 Tax=Stegodyphus dumicola TaxID=202533 RepID=UPI0015A7C536|nr:meiosis-specific with OB domain-containing protein-like isoform X2 [Stegodyphus dumicola]